MCGLELANMARITGPMVDAVRGNNPTAEMIYRLFEHYRDGDMESGLNMFDSTAVAYLLAPGALHHCGLLCGRRNRFPAHPRHDRLRP